MNTAPVTTTAIAAYDKYMLYGWGSDTKKLSFGCVLVMAEIYVSSMGAVKSTAFALSADSPTPDSSVLISWNHKTQTREIWAVQITSEFLSKTLVFVEYYP